MRVLPGHVPAIHVPSTPPIRVYNYVSTNRQDSTRRWIYRYVGERC